MDNEWPSPFISWLQADIASHPNSPAGGSGPGFSVPHISQSLRWPSPDAPHPHSPEGRYFNCPNSARDGGATFGELSLQIQQIERSIALCSDEIRASLPNRTLLSHFDRQSALMAGLPQTTAHDAAGTQAGVGLTGRLIQLSIKAYWFSPALGNSPSSTDAASLRRESATAWAAGTKEEKQRLLDRIQTLAMVIRDQTIANIQRSWKEAGRSGKQAELTETWRTRMRWIEELGAPGGTNAGASGKAASPDDQAVSNRSRTSETPKTWVEVQLVDIDGKPVPNEEFEVVLPNGSRRSGSLDSQGMARFDDIDPGQCKISFPQIDGREWRAI